MAEIDRRRRQKSDGSEKSFSESDAEVEDLNETPTSVKDTPEKDSQPKIGDGSEYESAEEEEKLDDQSYEENLKEQESLSELVNEEGGEEGIAEPEDVEGDFLNGEGDENGSEEGEYVEEEGEYVEEERQQGDGEECSPSSTGVEKELDFDEDRRNPQYIPKKGMFYEHDDRNNEDMKEKQEEPPRDRKKKLWLDEGKWGHDRFREEEQYPKSRNELIETYGYDIRNEDGPPRARRRRRYGRGPTKYDRSWEDVTAYGRERFKTSPRGSPRGSRGGGRFRGGNPRFRGRGRQDFNSENSRRSDESVKETSEVPVKDEQESPESKEIPPVINSEDFPALPAKISEPEIKETSETTIYSNSPPKTSEAKSVRTLTFENSNFSGRNSTERDIPPRRGKTPFSSNHDRGFSNNHDRGFSNNHDRGFSNNHDRGFNNNQDRSFNNHDRGFSNSHDRDFTSNHDREFSNNHDKGYNNNHDRGFSNNHDKGFSSNRDRGFSNNHDKGYSSNHDRGFNHERGVRRPNTRGGRGPGRGDYRGRGGRGNIQRHISPRFLENKVNNNLSAEMEQLSLEMNDNSEVCDHENITHSESTGDLPQNINEMALKGAGDSSGRPKRYSSLRQRSLPETSTYPTPPPPQVQTQHPPPYYETGYQQPLYAPTETCVPTPSTQSQTATSAPIMNPPPTAFQTFTTPPPYSDSYGLRMSVTPPPRLFPQVSVPAPQPILAAPPCITPTPTIMNFAPPPPPTGYPFTFQQFTTPPPPAPAPPAEIYQPGITYYYPHTQAPPIRPTVQKRAKAIPILPPPERETNRKDKNDSISSNNISHKFSENSNDIENVDIVRTETSSQLQSTVGVES